MQYKSQSNLQYITLLNSAISIWRSSNTRNKLRKFFMESHGWSIDGFILQRWNVLVREVLNETNSIALPQALGDELVDVVKELGVRIYNWVRYVHDNCLFQNNVYEQLLNCVEQLCWSNDGIIDDARVLSLFILDNQNLSIARGYEIACSYMLEEHVTSLWKKMPQGMRNNYSESIYENTNQHILGYWECHRNGNLSELVRYFEDAARRGGTLSTYNFLYNRHHSVEENMLRLSIHEGYAKAVQYFWDHLNEEERNRNIVNGARMSVVRYHSSDGDYFTKENYVEICVFLMNRTTPHQKEELFKSMITFSGSRGLSDESTRSYGYNLLVMLLSTWPWRQFFLETLNTMWEYVEKDQRAVANILYEIVYEVRKDWKLGYNIEHNKLRDVLRNMWRIIPSHLKEEIAQDHVILSVMCVLLEIHDVSIISLIMSAPEMISIKEECIALSEEKYVQLIKEDQYELLEKLMDALFITDAEKKTIRQRIDSYDYFITSNQYNLLDKLWNWQSDTEEEKKFLKNRIDCVNLCLRFIREKRHESADAFLNWRFDTKEEQRDFVNGFMLSDVGIKSLDDFIKSVSDEDAISTEEKIEKFNKLINFWIKPSGCINEVKSKLESCMILCKEKEQIEDYKMFIGLTIVEQDNVSHVNRVVQRRNTVGQIKDLTPS